MSESNEILTMRHMEWERVKGGIKAILASFWDNEEGYKKAKKVAKKFMVKFGEAAHID